MVHAVRFYSVNCYGLYETVGYAEAKRVAEAASEHLQTYPLHYGGKQRFALPYLGEVSAGKCIAVITSFLVWAQWKSGNDLQQQKGHPFW